MVMSIELGRQILLLTQQYKSNKEISEILGVSLRQLYYYKKKYQEFTNIDLSVESNTRLLIYKCHLCGMPTKDICRFFKVSAPTIYNITKQYRKKKIKLDFKISHIGIIE
jgi:transposase